MPKETVRSEYGVVLRMGVDIESEGGEGREGRGEERGEGRGEREGGGHLWMMRRSMP